MKTVRFTNILIVASVALVLLLAACGPSQGASATPAQGGVKSKQGSWFAELTADSAPDRKFRGFATFMPNGALMTTGQGDYRLGATQGTGHGRWTQNGRHIDSKTMKFVFDADGRLAAIKEEFSTGEMDESGDNFTGTTRVETYDLDGKLLKTETGTIKSVRISLERQFGK